MPERFFAGNTTRLHWASDRLSLLTGPPACGKTSLLFQFAFNCAAESAREVVFICNKKRLEYKPPFLSQGMDPALKTLGRIQMKLVRWINNLTFCCQFKKEDSNFPVHDDREAQLYVGDCDEIKKYFAAFHLLENFPVVVIIDDFGDFFSKGKYEDKYGTRDRNLALVHALGLCLNAISHANKKLQPGSSCKLLLSETHKPDNTSLFVYKRWIDSIFTIEDAKDGGTGSFFLKNIHNANRPTRIRTAKYSIASQYLQLEEVVEE